MPPTPPEPEAAVASTPTGGQDAAAEAGGSVRRWPRRMLVTTNILVLALIATGVAAYAYAQRTFSQIHRLHSLGLSTPGGNYVRIGHKKVRVVSRTSPPFTVLLIGADTRTGAAHSGLNVGSAATNSENLSDSIILARVSPATHQVALLSIPRDLWVKIPGIGMGKINSAFSGNVRRLIRVIQQDLGIPVNHFAEVNFDAFEQVARDIGGVEQYFPTPAFDPNSGLHVHQAGCVNLNGKEALAFVRSRDYFYIEPGQSAQLQLEPESDLARIQRQQAFLTNALHKIKRDGDLGNPVKLASILSSITKNLTVDSTFSNSQLLSLAEKFRTINPNGIPNETYPVRNATVNGESVLLGLPSADKAVVAKFESIGTVGVRQHRATSPKPAAPRGRGAGTRPTGPTSTTSSTTSTTLPHGSVAVAVENGNGVAGAATTATTALQSAGFTVTSAANASSYGYARTVVEFGPGQRRAAVTLRDAIGPGATLQRDPSAGSQVVLVLGRDWHGLRGGRSTAGTAGVGASPSSTSSSSTSSASSTTTVTVPSAAGTIYGSSKTVTPSSSSYYNGVYIPPGRKPGQKIQTCGN